MRAEKESAAKEAAAEIPKAEAKMGAERESAGKDAAEKAAAKIRAEESLEKEADENATPVDIVNAIRRRRIPHKQFPFDEPSTIAMGQLQKDFDDLPDWAFSELRPYFLQDSESDNLVLRWRDLTAEQKRYLVHRVRALKALVAAKIAKSKKKIVTKVATGRLRRVLVWTGRKAWTSGGMTKNDFEKNKHGRLVLKSRSCGNPRWIEACRRAKEALGLTGFVKIKKGTPVYLKAKELHQCK